MDQVVEYDVTEAAIKELSIKYAVVPDASNPEGYAAIKDALSELRPLRTAVEKRRKLLKVDALEYGRKVDSAAKGITDGLLAIETPFKEAKKAEDEREELEAQAAREAEEKRIAGLEERIADLGRQAEGLLNADSNSIKRQIELVEAVEPLMFDDYAQAASATKDKVLVTLHVALDARVELEAIKVDQEKAQKELDEKRAAFDLMAAAQKVDDDKRQAEFDKKEAEQKAAQKKIDDDREEAARIQQEGIERAEREKADKEEAEAKKLADAEKAAKAEALKPEIEKLRDWVLKLRFIDGPDGIEDERLIGLVRSVMSNLDMLAKQTIANLDGF